MTEQPINQNFVAKKNHTLFWEISFTILLNSSQGRKQRCLKHIRGHQNLSKVPWNGHNFIQKPIPFIFIPSGLLKLRIYWTNDDLLKWKNQHEIEEKKQHSCYTKPSTLFSVEEEKGEEKKNLRNEMKCKPVTLHFEYLAMHLLNSLSSESVN